MSQQGRCVLAAEEGERVLDRLGLLEKIITTAEIQQVLENTGRINRRACTLTHEVMMWIVLAMGLFTELPIRQVFKQARRLQEKEKTPGRSSLCLARQRLGLEPVLRLFEQVVRPLATPDTPGAFYRGWRLVGMDGSLYNLPDSRQNEAYFGRPSGERGPGAFPQARKLSLVELGTHVEFALEVGGYRTSEVAMAPALLKHLAPGMLLLWDRNFFSCKLWNAVISRKVAVLARVQKGYQLKPIRTLSDGSYLAEIRPSKRHGRKHRLPVRVRVIKYVLEDPRRVGHGEVHTLITSILDPTEAPALELIVLYHERWEHELTYDEQKCHLDPPRITKPTHMRSETAEGVVQEIYAVSLAHFVIRSFMFQAAQAAAIDPDRLSFTGCYHVLKCRLPECDTRSPKAFDRWYQALLWELECERTEPRRNRVNPRVVRQTQRKWAKKKPEHYRQPPLTKAFVQTAVVLR